MTGRTKNDKVRDAEPVMGSCQRIAREISDSVYSWETEGDRKIEAFWNRDNEKYINSQ